jgi:hypothetical protein
MASVADWPKPNARRAVKQAIGAPCNPGLDCLLFAEPKSLSSISDKAPQKILFQLPHPHNCLDAPPYPFIPSTWQLGSDHAKWLCIQVIILFSGDKNCLTRRLGRYAERNGLIMIEGRMSALL